MQYLDEITVNVSNICKAYGENNRVKQFSDCSPLSNITNLQICCYLTGVNADKSHYEGCIAVNYTLFFNKSISYTSSGISGSLICTNDYTSNNYINISIFNLTLFILFLLFS